MTSKPYPDFPLYAHTRGHWAKKIRNKTHYFGKIADGWEAALHEFNRTKDALYAGRHPDDYNNGTDIEEIAAEFLSSKMKLVRSGDLAQRTYDDYEHTCDMLVESFGSTRSVKSLQSGDFDVLREQLAKRYGPSRLGREIAQVRMIFRFAVEAGLIEKEVRFGTHFKPPSQRAHRLQRASVGSKLYEPGEITKLINAARQPIKSMVLLGINCGFENHDCGLLKFKDLNLATGWHTMARPKTGVARRCKLWTNTVDAISEWLERRPEPVDPAHMELVFVTKQHRGCWYKETRSNPISLEFRRLLESCDMYRRGRTFLALRHTFQTIGEDSGDTVAVGHIMGHVDVSMAARYRERIRDERLERVTDYVHEWLAEGSEGSAQKPIPPEKSAY